MKTQPLIYGDTVVLTADRLQFGDPAPKLGIYNKDPFYVVVGNITDELPVASAFEFRLDPPPGKCNGDVINYGDGFYLYNTTFDRYVTDDKTREGFNGYEGYFGLVYKSKIGTANANQYCLKGGNGPIPCDASGLKLSCASEQWKCKGKMLKAFPINEGMYLRWDRSDSDDFVSPTFTLKNVEVVKNWQYGFAHRVLLTNTIESVLKAQGTGIEIDLGYDSSRGTWYVQHDSPDVWDGTHPSLDAWLQKLHQLLTHAEYPSFAALWLDVKTPDTTALTKTVTSIRKNVPKSVAVIYDLGSPAHYGVNGLTTNGGYIAIKSLGLQENEGFGVWFSDIRPVKPTYDLFKRDQITRVIAHAGNPIDIPDDVLTAINESGYLDPADAYRFKQLFSWTNMREATMKAYVNPSNSYHTDGQIIGSAFRDWETGYFSDIIDFSNAVAEFKASQQLAVRSVDKFWKV